MSRPGLSEAQIAAASAPFLQYAYFVEIDWPGDPARMFSGWGQIVTGAGEDVKTWLGTGMLGRVAEIGETIRDEVRGAVYELSGVANAAGEALLDALLAEPGGTVPVRLYVGLFDPESGSVIGDLILLREDLDDRIVRTQGGTEAVLTLTAEPPGLDRTLRGPRLFSPAAQKALYPDDTGMDRQPGIGVREIKLDG